ncbi:Quinolinate synthase [Trichinella spiralis]|uniref:Quinolinate synthase n=1 Tax=Trichinella spiralis TaxID=6334 RepID=A0ABR3K607_TRISP
MTDRWATGRYALGHHRSAIWLDYASAVCSPRSVSPLPSTLLRQQVRGAAARGLRWPKLAYPWSPVLFLPGERRCPCTRF